MGSTRVEDFRLEAWLPYWLSADDLIAGLAAMAILVALAIMHVDAPPCETDKFSSRDG
jgi:hypothetical protein